MERIFSLGVGAKSLVMGVQNIVQNEGTSGIYYVGAAIAKVPVISKGPVDEALIAAGEKLEERNTARIDGALGRLIEVSENYTLYFVECIEEINRICNRTEGAVICRGNIYFL